MSEQDRQEWGINRRTAPPTVRPLGIEPLIAVIGTGIYAAFQIALCVTGLVLLSNEGALRESWATLVVIGFFTAGPIGYFSLCGWMTAVRSRLHDARMTTPGGWTIWLSWFIPLYGFIGPAIAMGKIRPPRARTDELMVGAWWLTFLGYVIADRVVSSVDLGDARRGWLIAMIVLISLSYAALVRLIKDYSAHAPGQPAVTRGTPQHESAPAELTEGA